jgi:hypothetical protein
MNKTVVDLSTGQISQVPMSAEELSEVEQAQSNGREFAKTQYKRDRSAEYPAIGDQLDALFKAGVFPADMAATIQAVKDKYPKA